MPPGASKETKASGGFCKVMGHDAAESQTHNSRNLDRWRNTHLSKLRCVLCRETKQFLLPFIVTSGADAAAPAGHR